MTQELNSVVEISNTLSNNIYAYVIFISLIFLISFLFLGYQLLNIFKDMLIKVMEDVNRKLGNIEKEIRELKERKWYIMTKAIILSLLRTIGWGAVRGIVKITPTKKDDIVLEEIEKFFKETNTK